MAKRKLSQALKVGALLCALMLALTSGAFADWLETPTEKFKLSDIPEIKNKRSIHIALFGGTKQFDIEVPKMIKAFEKKTGIKVTSEKMIMTSIYPKINAELMAGSGAYDCIVMETSTTNEWAPYLWDVRELAAKYEPTGLAGLESDLIGHDPALLRTTSDVNGKLRGIPYWNYEQVLYYRQDLIEDPIEKAAFLKKYGYALAVPVTRKQLYDVAEFFTRKAGQKLKGEVLKKDLYGVALMAGRFEINDEISSMVWGAGGHWATIIRDKNGKAKEFVITKKDKRIQKEAIEHYISLLKFASPGCLTGFWDFCCAQFVEGLAVMMPNLYLVVEDWTWQVEKKVPGAKKGMALCVGRQGYIGDFAECVAKASKNPEAAYWFIKFLGGFQAQRTLMERGFPGVRIDIMGDPKYQNDPKWKKPIGDRAYINSLALSVQNNYVNDYIHFNSAAMGKIYEMQIIELHNAAIKKYTPEECVKVITAKTIKLQKKFGRLPIREEK
jgi:multiple sugar transport system substrate-binding protein